MFRAVPRKPSMETKKTSSATLAPDLELWRRMFRISDLFRTVVGKESDRADLNRITVNQARIFGYIFSRSGTIRITRLARDLDVTVAAAGQAVDRLVKAGLVDRRVDPADRRAFAITVSRKGIARLRRYEERCRAISDAVFASLPPADVAAFDRVLSAVYADLSDRWEAILAAREQS